MSEEQVQDSGEYSEEAAPVMDEVLDSQGSEQVEGGEQERSSQVPLDALKAEREQRQKLQEELSMIKDHLSLMQANQNAPQQTQKDDYDGLEDDDVMTIGEFKKLANKFQAQQQQSLTEMKMAQKYPDYQEVIQTYLPEVIKQNPSLKDSLAKTQDYELAYYLAKNSDVYKQKNTKRKRSAEAERIMENTQAAGSLSSMGAASPIKQVKSYKSMSDSDFREQVQRNLGYT